MSSPRIRDVYGRSIPFLEFVGVDPQRQEDGSFVMRMQLAPHLIGGAQSAHGGVVMTLLDVAMSSAAKQADRNTRNCVTIEMKTSFFRPAGECGGFIEARGIAKHTTRSLAFCEGELRSDKGELVATSTGTFKYYPPAPSGSPISSRSN